jgi:hypothetical protein
LWTLYQNHLGLVCYTHSGWRWWRTGPVTMEESDGELGRDKTRIIIAHADDLCLGILVSDASGIERVRGWKAGFS